MGLLSGILMGIIFGIGLMAGWVRMMRYRSIKRVAKVGDLIVLLSFFFFFFLFDVWRV